MRMESLSKAQLAANSWRASTRCDLIIEIWEALDCESVGARELELIQHVLGEKLGAGAVESPATIARVVAEEGAALRHPEVFECDLKWREGKVTAPFPDLDFSTLRSALESFGVVETQRRDLEERKDREGLQGLSDGIAAARQDCLLIARSKIVAEAQRAESKEVAEWLRVWLVAPELFRDWLELRMRSAEFQKNFGGGSNSLKA